MRAAINKVLDQLEAVYSPDSTSVSNQQVESLITQLAPVQDAYIEVIQEALCSLTAGNKEESHQRLQNQRDKLDSTLNRISSLIEQLAESDIEPLKLIVEYLYTRARLVDELKMFPDFGLELLETQNQEGDPAPDETIALMERLMTGREQLYDKILAYQVPSQI